MPSGIAVILSTGSAWRGSTSTDEAQATRTPSRRRRAFVKDMKAFFAEENQTHRVLSNGHHVLRSLLRKIGMNQRVLYEIAPTAITAASSIQYWM
jgi:hypothetical protein